MRKIIPDKLKKIIWKYGSYRLIDQKKLYTLWEENHLRRLLAHYDVDCVFDVGANYGQYAQMLRRRANYQGLIISFEPTPEAASVLRERAACDPKWVIEEEALSTHDGEQIFNIMSNSEFSSLSSPRHDEIGLFRNMNKVEQSFSVKTETLITAYRRLKKAYNFRRPFLKLDTQGHDVMIVTHGKPIIKEFVGLQSELTIKPIYSESVDYREALKIYEACGFALSAFVPNNAGHFPQLIETDCIMVRGDLLERSL
jgi:FkbM family methyltransferase